MNNHKRSSTILLALLFCMTLSNALFAQPGENKLENLIRVDAQPFMTENELSHGYFVFRCKIQNLDVKPHKITLACNDVASKSFELQAGETINASLPLPVTNSRFGNSIQVHADNKRLYSVSCSMRRASVPYISPHFRTAFVSYYPDDDSVSNTYLVCRSLRKQFTEAECIFAEKDCKFWPQDRLDYSCLDFIFLTPAELAAAPQGVQTALRQFVLCGGTLWLIDCDIQKDDLDKISWIAQLRTEVSPKADSSPNPTVLQYQAGFGSVALTDRSALEKLYSQDKPRKRDSNEFEHSNFDSNSDSNKTEQKLSDQEVFSDLCNHFDPKPSWFKQSHLNEMQKWFPVVKDLSIPIIGIGIVIFLFVLLAGPANLFILSKYNKRILLLVTVPVLSFLFAGAILMYVILADGFKTDARISSAAYLDQQDGTYSSMIQYGVYARTMPRNVVFDSDDELNISEISEDDCFIIDWTSGKQVIPSHFATARKPAYYKIRKTGTTRLKLDFDFNGDNPYVVNGLGKDVKKLFVRDAEGNLWRAESIAAGQKATLTPVNRQYNEKLSNAAPLSYCISTSRWDFNEHSVNIQNNADALHPGSYIAAFSSSGPFANKGVSYAKEKNSFAFLFGRF